MKPSAYYQQSYHKPYQKSGFSYGTQVQHLELLDFDENTFMDDIDIEEILECEDIEQTAMINSSRSLLSVIDNMIACIDDRLNARRAGNFDDPYGSRRKMDYARLGGLHDHQYSKGFEKSRMNAESIDKTRRVSVMY